MNLYPYIKTRSIKRFYNTNKNCILPIVAVLSFLLGFLYISNREYKIMQQYVQSFTMSSQYNKADNTNTFDNNKVDILLDTFGLDH